MLPAGNPREGRHLFALAPGAEDANFARAEIADGAILDNRGIGYLDVAVLPGDGDDVFHASAEDADLAAVLDGDLDDLLDTIDVAREGRDDDAPEGFFEDVLDAFADVGL